ncbi:cyclic beta-1,2-glucan synthetase [Nitrosomonas eutropha]|uniref:Cyclic beta-1,2-glucan synthetase n=1 Tax=Nitrosomonas eutropha TaxID=916 RepID=A0A1I7ICW1_9PROT|nr:glucoamylase family protein [Nitrosomonas eutropha]SFU70784.1 cyclic beta-1,2-glucan synthetase [Nitrosomonas eutropha]
MNLHFIQTLGLFRSRFPGNSDPLIRSTLGPHSNPSQLGVAIAQGSKAYLAGLHHFKLRERTRENALYIRAVLRTLNRAQQRGENVTPTASWLLENAHVIEEAIPAVLRDLPPRFYLQLPSMPNSKVSRTLAIAWAYIADVDSAVSEEGFRTLVEGFQTVQPLNIGELWVLPSLLRFVLVENLRRMAIRIVHTHDMRLTANLIANRLIDASPEEETGILADYAKYAQDRTFATQFLHRLRDGSHISHKGLLWLESALKAAQTTAEQITLDEHADLSINGIITGNIFRSLRLIDDIDWTNWFEQVSLIDQLLRARTNFAALDFASRDTYRNAIETLTKRSGQNEHDVARQVVELAETTSDETAHNPDKVDIGSFLVGSRRHELENILGCTTPFGERLRDAWRKSSWLGIVLPVSLITGLLLAVATLRLRTEESDVYVLLLLLALSLIPAIEAANGLFNAFITMLIKPDKLIGYEFKEGVPDDARTFVVVPTLIGNRDEVEQAIRDLEILYLANMKGTLYFALLSDWPDSSMEETPADRKLLAFAHKQMAALNNRYPNKNFTRFYFLHRNRLYNEAEGCWMGWERKRGKLQEFNALLRGDASTTYFTPDNPLPEDVKYVLTLDADTRTTRDAIARLVGKLAHPLNHPIFDTENRQLRTGYGILQPRITPSLTVGDKASLFQRISSTNRGMNPYVFAVSDIYQDLFAEGIFTGKGLYHIDTMTAALQGRIPENTVLSHDLLEGAYARAALVTDIEVVEDYPTRYLVDSARRHRWVRGDWQLLPWIFNPKSGLSMLSRCQMIDNLRRSITPISWIAAAIAGWTLLSSELATEWLVLLALCLFLPQAPGLLSALLRRDSRTTLGSHFAAFARDTLLAVTQIVARIILMAHQAWSLSDAILRTLHRLLISKQRLLEWRTASQEMRFSERSLAGHFRIMSGALIIATAGLIIPLILGADGITVAIVFTLLWAGSPILAWLISHPAEAESRLKIAPEDISALRRIARRTWLYFETFVTSEHHMLPPDNYQEKPIPLVAGRSSPTNIGVYLLSTIAARDFGWIGFIKTVERLEGTFATLQKMERFRGHLYNWYDTRSLEPLQPLYISSVDSGNLAGHLITAAAACDNWSAALAVHLQGDYEGIIDCTDILHETLKVLPDDRKSLRPLRQRLGERLKSMHHAVNALHHEPGTASIRTINLVALATDIVNLAKALDEEIHSPACEKLVLWAQNLEKTCNAHLSDTHTDAETVKQLRQRLLTLHDGLRKFAFEMDFQFLLRPERKLLSIGYRVTERQLDESCYDLLASEARLTSLFAIAKGDLPTRHWFRLGRPITAIGFSGALMSWSGSMFEYLMPALVMKEPLGSILNQTNQLIIERQIAYGRKKGVPWGVSESAYNARDREMTYQYTSFGIPELGLKRGLAKDTVIAPYASLLAVQFRPKEAVANLNRLETLGALGYYGFHDAVDFTPERLPKDRGCAVVRNFMAHHHGMSIIAINNALLNGRMRERFHADPVIEAAELLLQEKAPRTVPAMPIHAETSDRIEPELLDQRPDSRLITNPLIAPRAVNVMSNGHYSLMLTASGSGYSRIGEIALTHWNNDPNEERTGTFLFISDPATGAWWSATAEPKHVPNEICHTTFYNDRAIFSKKVGQLRSETECIVMSEYDGEMRRITLWNNGDEDRHIEITSFAELVLAPEANHSAHPSFSKMFVRTEICHNNTTIFAERRKRLETEPDMALAHLVTFSEGMLREVEAETDRRTFIGRGRSIANAAAFDPNTRLSQKAGFTLDPVMALRVKIRVPTRRKISVAFWTIAGKNRSELEQNIHRLVHPGCFRRQAKLAWTRSQIQARYVGLKLAETSGVQKLARYLLYPHPVLRAPVDTIAPGPSQQSMLWPLAISGDFPIFVLRIADITDLAIIIHALRIQEYLRSRNLIFDLAVINEQPTSYVQDLQQAIEQLCSNARLLNGESGSCQHIFAIRRDLIDADTYSALLAIAYISLHTHNGPVLDQIERAEIALARHKTTAPPSIRLQQAAPVTVYSQDLTFWNGFGGFANSGREYVVRLSGNRVTPHPWINIIANDNFGFHTSSEGASFTWSRNSRDFHLTPWSNDPVTDRPGEGIYIHDLDTGAAFSPFACLLRDPAAVYEARHARGVSSFTIQRGSLTATLTQLVDPIDPVKIQRLWFKNTGSKPRKFRIYAYAEWILGNHRSRCAPFIVTDRDPTTGALSAHNPYHLTFDNITAFLACDGNNQHFTCNRSEFIGPGGSTSAPVAVLTGATLSDSLTANADPCAVLACDIKIAPGSEATLHFVLGTADSLQEISELAQPHLARDFDTRLTDNYAAWNKFASTLQVQTPDPAFNAMVNVWLPYQALTCRIRARSAFYQASGAYGFRDQLQDTLALLLHDSTLARMQILNAASRQFVQGDVQHWWLPLSGSGVRTTISDDVVWLVYTTWHYIKTTDDYAILDEELPFITGPELEQGQADAFFTPETAEESACLYEHCAHALDLAIKRKGENDLPLILGGDWNDGMNLVGKAGQGTSTWLGWFLLKTLRDFAPVARQRDDIKRAEAWEQHTHCLALALQAHAWDGHWYRRGSYDDGTFLGSQSSDECRIDSIAQSWAVLSGADDLPRARQAVDQAIKMLVDDNSGIVRLFTPPFQHTSKEPGYIKSYPPGIRENGGQYTHAATWLVAALTELGNADEAYRLFSLLNPVNHALDEAAASRYRVEPYVVAADIYSEGRQAGQGGWTWYTGSAGWLYRVAVENILGILREGAVLRIKPALPSTWDSFYVQLHIDTAYYNVTVKRAASASCTLDGRLIENFLIPLEKNGQHEIMINVI